MKPEHLHYYGSLVIQFLGIYPRLFHRVVSKPFRHNLGFILQLGTEHANVFMGDTDTIIIGVIIQIAFGYEIEYIVEKNVKNQGTWYRSLWNTFKQFCPLTPSVSQ